MIRSTGCAQAPVDVIGLVGAIGRTVTLVALTKTGAAAGFPAAVIIRNHIVTAVCRIMTGADPGHGRHLGTGRASVSTPPTAAA